MVFHPDVGASLPSFRDRDCSGKGSVTDDGERRVRGACV